MDDLSQARQQAVAFIIAWIERDPTAARLAAIASCCNWQIEEVDELISWIIHHRNCSAEIALNLLDASGFWNLDEESLREDEAFPLWKYMIERLAY